MFISHLFSSIVYSESSSFIHGTQIKNALFCMDKMNDLCDEEAAEEFCALNTELVLDAWLHELQEKYNELMQAAADKNDASAIFDLPEECPVKV
jgi:adenosylmethionine-8-amino-7-oxononanoate aminotransferase